MSSALIPYATSEMAPLATQLGFELGKKLGEAALGAGKRMATKTVRKVGRTAKRRNTSVRGAAKIGEAVGSSSAKWDTLSSNYFSMNPETLAQIRLLDITKTSGGDAYDRRLMDQLNFRGIKICMNFRAEGQLGTAKVFMNVAVISPKSEIASNQLLPNNDFFRNPTGNTRGIAFDDPVLTSLDYHCSSINTDKYTVHKRIKFEVGPAQSTEGHKSKFIEFYVPLKRQIRYENLSSFPEGRNMYLLWWYSTSDGGTPADGVRYSYRVTRYFKETVGM